MKWLGLVGVAIVIMMNTTILHAAQSCLDEAELKRLDGQYEQSLVKDDHVFLEALLAEEFIWVHNHASSIDTKESLTERLSSSEGQPTNKSRVSSDVEVRRRGNAAVIMGYTTVERHDEYVKRTGGPRSAKYHFMRTYVLVDGRCLLLGNHTMKVWDSSEQ
jgi:hypothetical protein